MIRRAPLAIALLASACGQVSAQAVAPGIYGNVTPSEETGDVNGAEFELIGTGADARVELVLCEGWCTAIRRAPVRFTPDGFAFSYVETYVDQDGKPAGSKTFDAAVRRKPSGLTLTITPRDAPGQSFAYDLRPIDKRYGLFIASGEK